ncbi:MAG: sulfotransferase [Ketobacter sp.]
MIGQLDKIYLTFGKRNAFHRLVSYFFFEGRPHTTRGQFLNPFVKTFLNLLAELPGSPSPDRPIYITGLGRSGTTVLGKILSLHKDVGFLNEPKLMWSLADPQTDVCGDYVDSSGRFMLNPDDAHAETKLKIGRVLSRYAFLTGIKRPLDKYPEFIFRVGYLKSILPTSKIVFISRNGNDAVASVAHWSQDKGVVVGERTDDWWGRGDIKWTYLCDQIFTVLPEYSDVAKLDLNKLDHVNRAALEWIVTMRQGIETLNSWPNDVYHIKYEDLVREPAIELEKLLRACELAPSDDVLAYSQKALKVRERKAKPELEETISQLFDETMSMLGY